MSSVRSAVVSIVVLVCAVRSRILAADSATLRAADAGVSPDFCPALQALVSGAAEGFGSLRGKSLERGEHMWEGTKRLPGSTECVVFGGAPPSYTCTLYAGDVEEKADGAYERGVAGVKDCLPGGWQTSEKVNGIRDRTTSARGTTGPRIRVVSRDLDADAYSVELWVDAPKP